MAEGRHRQARHRQPRRKVIGPGIVKVAIPGATVALLATGSAVAFPEQEHKPTASDAPLASSPLQLARETRTSRDAYRPSLDLKPSTPPAAKPKPKAPPVAKHLKKQAPIPAPKSVKTRAAQTAKALPPKIVGSKFTTTDLNVWTAPQQKGTLLTVLSKGSKVSVTGEVEGLWAEIVRNGVVRWVKAEYLSATKPVEKTEEAASGISSAACKSGSGVENGLTDDAIRVHRAVCAAFPSVSSYGGVRSGDGGAHGSGRGLDIMVTGSLGDEIAAYVRANARKLGVSEVIWEQRIWTVQRSSEGWRGMEDRGDATANHFDHVHVSVYGNAGTV